MLKRAAFILALAALALPAAALAKTYDVSGRLGLFGKGDVTADLTADSATRPVRIAVLGGSLTITSVSNDVQIRCRSRADGKASTTCSGNAVLAVVTGSHFQIQASGKRFVLGVPQGYTGTVDAATAKQCGVELNCRAAIRALRRNAQGHGNAGGNGAGNGNGATATATGGDTVTADPGTDESLKQLEAALAALGK